MICTYCEKSSRVVNDLDVVAPVVEPAATEIKTVRTYSIHTSI